MREIRIPKRNGKYRRIVVPSPAERANLRMILPHVTAIAFALDVHSVAHGFVPGRSPVTCARMHVGFAFTVSFDLADCFDHIGKPHITKHFACEHREALQKDRNALFYNGRAAQGLPTSPALCNIALSDLDNDIMAKLAGRGVYTRYADDLTISTNDRAVVDEFLRDLPAMVRAHDHEINPAKTEVQSAKGGRRIVVGIAVDGAGIHSTRKAKRRLRAALHQKNKRQARGLREWTLLKSPNPMKRVQTLIAEDCVHSHLLARMLVARHVANE